MYRTYTGGEAPPITTIKSTQAAPEILTLPQVTPTSIPIPIPHKSTFLPFHFSSDTEFQIWGRCQTFSGRNLRPTPIETGGPTETC